MMKITLSKMRLYRRILCFRLLQNPVKKRTSKTLKQSWFSASNTRIFCRLKWNFVWFLILKRNPQTLKITISDTRFSWNQTINHVNRPSLKSSQSAVFQKKCRFQKRDSLYNLQRFSLKKTNFFFIKNKTFLLENDTSVLFFIFLSYSFLYLFSVFLKNNYYLFVHGADEIKH